MVLSASETRIVCVCLYVRVRGLVMVVLGVP